MNSYIILLNAVAGSNATAKILYVTLDKTLARKQYAKKIASLTKRGESLFNLFSEIFHLDIPKTVRRGYSHDMFSIKQNHMMLSLTMNYVQEYTITISILEHEVAF